MVRTVLSATPENSEEAARIIISRNIEAWMIGVSQVEILSKGLYLRLNCNMHCIVAWEDSNSWLASTRSSDVMFSHTVLASSPIQQRVRPYIIILLLLSNPIFLKGWKMLTSPHQLVDTHHLSRCPTPLPHTYYYFTVQAHCIFHLFKCDDVAAFWGPWRNDAEL